jgi:hypothetical protein
LLPLLQRALRDAQHRSKLCLRQPSLQTRLRDGRPGSTEVRLPRPALSSRTPSSTSCRISRLASVLVRARPVSFLVMSNNSFRLRFWRTRVNPPGRTTKSEDLTQSHRTRERITRVQGYRP